MIKSVITWYDNLIEKCRKIDFLVLLSIRLFLVPVIFVGARSKVLAMPAPSHGLALP
ncbi:DoxX family protein [Vibrio maritimus]|uniref:DoxX family protein n=1 Tax=Vibrio maritimus TaxID=990268 RepID=A0A090RZC0_9VIBR|nr:DoxX family protein [Vibrio maritimus]